MSSRTSLTVTETLARMGRPPGRDNGRGPAGQLGDDADEGERAPDELEQRRRLLALVAGRFGELTDDHGLGTDVDRSALADLLRRVELQVEAQRDDWLDGFCRALGLVVAPPASTLFCWVIFNDVGLNWTGNAASGSVGSSAFLPVPLTCFSRPLDLRAGSNRALQLTCTVRAPSRQRLMGNV